MKDLKFTVTNDVLNLGVKVMTVRLTGIKNTDSSDEFEMYKAETLNNIRNEFSDKNYKENLTLTGFRDLHIKVGRSNRDYIASPEALLGRFLKTNKFPHVNLLVDIYNLQSMKSRLAMGAHDIDKINGNVTLKLTNGDESFLPLGCIENVKVFPGEYSYVDDVNNIICRLEVLQVEQTKVTEKSEDIFLIIQGNMNTEEIHITEAANELCSLICEFCKGGYTLLN